MAVSGMLSQLLYFRKRLSRTPGTGGWVGPRGGLEARVKSLVSAGNQTTVPQLTRPKPSQYSALQTLAKLHAVASTHTAIFTQCMTVTVILLPVRRSPCSIAILGTTKPSDGPHTCQHCVGSDQGLPLSAPAFIQQLEDTIPAESLLHWNYFKKGFDYEHYTEKQKIY
jgi:hypothetical protein